MRKWEARTAKARRIDVLAGLTRDLIFIFMMGIYYDRKQTRILLGIAIVFVFCQCFTIIPDILELMCTLSTKHCQETIYTYSVIEFGHLMLAFNSSINFIFYMIHIQLYREERIFKVFIFAWYNVGSINKENTVIYLGIYKI